MRVAESIVIFRPIRQVGWFNASAAERSTGRRQDQPPHLGGLAAVQALMNRVVLAVHRENRDAVSHRSLGDEAAGHDEHFLVGERDRLALFDRREHGLQRLGPARGAQHEVDVGLRRNSHEAVASGTRDRRAAD
jgi:hypothetical protein